MCGCVVVSCIRMLVGCGVVWCVVWLGDRVLSCGSACARVGGAGVVVRVVTVAVMCVV